MHELVATVIEALIVERRLGSRFGSLGGARRNLQKTGWHVVIIDLYLSDALLKDYRPLFTRGALSLAELKQIKGGLIAHELNRV